jgi:hypothetical protein
MNITKSSKEIRHGQDQLISFLWIRRGIGLLGIILPLVLLLGNNLLSNCNTIQYSISDYYHSNMRDVFVGVICLIALFLFTYRGYDKSDNIASNLACIFALGVAFLPTSIKSTNNNCLNCNYIMYPILHTISAVCFFLILTYFALIQFPKSEKLDEAIKVINSEIISASKKRKMIYLACGVVMFLSILLIGADMLFGKKIDFLANKPVVFYLEWAALWAFGISWIVKGKWILNKE